jgi:hypothetical protein
LSRIFTECFRSACIQEVEVSFHVDGTPRDLVWFWLPVSDEDDQDTSSPAWIPSESATQEFIKNVKYGRPEVRRIVFETAWKVVDADDDYISHAAWSLLYSPGLTHPPDGARSETNRYFRSTSWLQVGNEYAKVEINDFNFRMHQSRFQEELSDHSTSEDEEATSTSESEPNDD